MNQQLRPLRIVGGFALMFLAIWTRGRFSSLGVPANDFGAQEPGSNATIKEFCESKYDVTFPMTGKEVVKGGAAHPFYKWAAATLGQKNTPQWNFHKYLVSADGTLVAAFPSAVEPESKAVKTAVEKELAKETH